MLAATTTSHLARGRRLVHFALCAAHSHSRSLYYPPSPPQASCTFTFAHALALDVFHAAAAAAAAVAQQAHDRCYALISPPVSPPSPHTPARRSPRSPAALCCCFQARCSPPALDVRVCGAVSARAKPPPARHEGTPTSPRRSPTAYGRCRRVRAHALTQVRSSAGR